ncbi:MAG: YitT family protein [Bacteroidales bacterium]|nr:YitT family protein [Bacteroidales bacterium]
MKIITKEKFLSKDWILAYSLILIGAFTMAVGYVFFISPYKFAPGGVYGISIIIHHLTVGLIDFLPEGLPIGLTALAMDIPLTIIGTKILGPRFGAKTVVGFVSLAIFTDVLENLWGNQPLVENQPLLSAIYGGLLIGLGLGLVFRSRATSGGSDIVAMIIEKYTKMPLGQLMIIVDGAIVLLTILAFKDWSLPLLSLIIIFITGKVVDIVLEGLSHNKSVIIISDKYEEIKEIIIKDIDRGGTSINAKGLYHDTDKKIIFTVLSRREVEILKEYIHEIDKNAFLTIFDASEILGNGFKPLSR